MKYPCLDVDGVDGDLVLALVDDFAPTAVEERPDGLSIFFSTGTSRDRAREAVTAALPQAAVAAREVDDEDWARRSQENLTPITVGRITVTPPWFVASASASAASDLGPPTSNLQPQTPNLQPATSDLRIVILPSMGFGTGHHATTRLCLEALQAQPVAGARVLDVGTGSGVLAIAAARLGAPEALGIDFDPDAITNALENLELNPEAPSVRFEVVDVRDAALPRADLVLANLTGAVLIQNASLLSGAVAPGGTLIVSGLQAHERDEVVSAFGALQPRWEKEEAGWVCIAFNQTGSSSV